MKRAGNNVNKDFYIGKKERQIYQGRMPISPTMPNLLDEIEKEIRRFIWLPCDDDYAIVAVWALYTSAFPGFDYAPRLALHSNLPGSGKSTLIRILKHLVFNGRHQISVTPATLFRQLGGGPVTLLIDEFDKSIGPKGLGDIHTILNAGHERGVMVPRANQDQGYKVEEFEPFGPVAFGIKNKSLPDDLAERSISIRMERSRGNLERFKEPLHGPRLDELRKLGQGWASEKAEALRNAEPAMMGIVNRAADNWRPLFAVAEVVGGEWPRRIREAALSYENSKPQTEPSLILLENLHDIHDQLRPRDGFVSTVTLLAELTGNPEWLWSDYQYGEPLSARGLARLLNGVGVRPNQPSRGGRRGYRWEKIAEAWEKYGIRSASEESSASGASLARAA